MSEPESSTASEPESTVPSETEGLEAREPKTSAASGLESSSARKQPLISRRSLVLGVVSSGILLAAGGIAKAVAGEISVVRPPGSQSEEHFIGACIRCNRCAGACPREAIVNCDFGEGVINIRTPRMSFRAKRMDVYRLEEAKDQVETGAGAGAGAETETETEVEVEAGVGPETATEAGAGIDPDAGLYLALRSAHGTQFCDFCMRCIECCPTGALLRFDPRTEWIGEAVIDTAHCIAFNKLGGCRKCADYCPFGAISIDGNRFPVVDSGKCNGCGVCENICPSSSYRSYSASTLRGINVTAFGHARAEAGRGGAR